MKTTQLISDTLPTLKTSDTGSHALQLMNDFHVQHLAVVDEKKLLGLISEEIILNHHHDEDVVGSYELLNNKIYVIDEEHIFELLKIAFDSKLTIVAVLDKDKKFLGVVTRFNMINYFVTETDLTAPGSILVLDVAEKNYSMAEIARIVEGENARIIGSFIGTSQETKHTTITLKLNVEDLQPLIQAFERFSYVVLESYQEPEYFDNLKDRYDSLMNFLNV